MTIRKRTPWPWWLHGGGMEPQLRLGDLHLENIIEVARCQTAVVVGARVPRVDIHETLKYSP